MSVSKNNKEQRQINECVFEHRLAVFWQHRPGGGGERWGALASGPSTHLSTQHGVGSSDTHRNRLNLLFPPPPVHYYGPPCRANATLLLSSHPLPCSPSLSVCCCSFQLSSSSFFFFFFTKSPIFLFTF